MSNSRIARYKTKGSTTSSLAYTDPSNISSGSGSGPKLPGPNLTARLQGKPSQVIPSLGVSKSKQSGPTRGSGTASPRKIPIVIPSIKKLDQGDIVDGKTKNNICVLPKLGYHADDSRIIPPSGSPNVKVANTDGNGRFGFRTSSTNSCDHQGDNNLLSSQSKSKDFDLSAGSVSYPNGTRLVVDSARGDPDTTDTDGKVLGNDIDPDDLNNGHDHLMARSRLDSCCSRISPSRLGGCGQGPKSSRLRSPNSCLPHLKENDHFSDDSTRIIDKKKIDTFSYEDIEDDCSTALSSVISDNSCFELDMDESGSETRNGVAVDLKQPGLPPNNSCDSEKDIQQNCRSEILEQPQFTDSCINPIESNVIHSKSPDDPQHLSPINAFDQDSGNETGLEESQFLDLHNRIGGTGSSIGMADSFQGLMDSSFHGTEDSLDGYKSSVPSEDQGLASSMEGELDDRGLNSTIQIYTDWANHYLEKARYKRFITDLQVDICDGVLLADIIQAVTSETVRDVHSQPCNATQMVENISTCLSFLAGLGVNVDGLSARDIRDGNLKAILGLFFSLSRFKQQQKSQTATSQNQQNHNNASQQNTPTTPVTNGNRNHSNLSGHYSNVGSRRNSNTGGTDSTNGNPDMHSRFTSPQKGLSSSRCPTVSQSTTSKDNSLGRTSTSSSTSSTPNNLNKLSKGHYSSLDRGRSQLTCPNNNIISNSGSLTKPPSKDTSGSRESSIPSRSGSPNPRTIPIRSSNRSLGPPRTTERTSSLGPTRSQERPSSSRSAIPATSSLPGPGGQSLVGPRPASAGSAQSQTGIKDKSMLDKFKLFKDKGDKSKGSASKGTKSSSNGASSTAAPVPPTANGPAKKAEPKSPTGLNPDGAYGGGAVSASASPKPGLKLGKKGFGRSKKDPLPPTPTTPQSSTSSLSREESSSRRTSSSSSSIPSRTASNTSVSSATSSTAGAKKTSRSSTGENSRSCDSSNRSGLQSGQSSPGTGRKGSKIASLTPSKSKSVPRHGPTTPGGSAIQGTGFPGPATTPTGSSGIPNPKSGSSSSSMGRQPKESSSSSKSRMPASSSSKSSLSSLQGTTGRQRGDRDGSAPSNMSSGAGGPPQGGQYNDPRQMNMSHPQRGPMPPQYQTDHHAPSTGHSSSSRMQPPKQLAMDPKEISKSMKVNNTNFAQQDVSPEKITSSMHDKNANIKAAAAAAAHATSSGHGSHSNLRGQKLNNSKSSERMNGSRSSERLQYNLSPAPQSSSRSASPHMGGGGIPSSQKVPNKMASTGSQGSHSIQQQDNPKSKSAKVDSDTQTAASAMHHQAVKQQHQQQLHQQQMQQQQHQQQKQHQQSQRHHQQQQQQLQQQHYQQQQHSGQNHGAHLQHPQQQMSPHRQLPSDHSGSLPRSNNSQHHPPPPTHPPPLPPTVQMPKGHGMVQMGKAPIQQKHMQGPVPTHHQNNLHPNQSSPRSSPRPGDPRSHLTDIGVTKKSNSSLSSGDSTNISSAGEDSNLSSSNSASNSNNSASSTDSVIYRPSSCDELESGADSDSNYGKKTIKVPQNMQVPPPQPVVQDHISSLRQQKRDKEASPQRNIASKKVETTFDAEVRTEETKPKSDKGQKVSNKETTLGGGEDMDSFDVDIKPMQPLMRSTPYAYLRNLPLLRPSLHIPSLSSQNSGLANSASSRLGVNRPLIDPSKLYTNSMKRTMSNSMDADYGSDIEGFDVQAGYMSDGDILRSSHTDDINSGYMSEGGASLYAKRMQQRFREGIMAVKECMQKSSGMADDDSFDDSSSISSGDISDTINDVSTDDITCSSLSGTSSERTNPYGSLKRGVPTGIGPQQSQHPVTSRSLPNRTGNLFYPNAGKSLLGRNLNVHGRDNLDNILGENWKKYCISEDGGSSAFTPDGKEQKQYPIGIPGAMFIKKKSNQATITDLRSRSLRNQGGIAVAVEDPQLDGTDGQPPNSNKLKKDSETNTDHSVMMMRRAGGRQPPPTSNGKQVAGFGFRRPLSTSSNASTSSTGSRGSNRMTEAEAIKGERLSNYNKGGVASPAKGPHHGANGHLSDHSSTDMGPEAYSMSTLERKKKANLVSSRTQTNITTTAATSPHSDYQSNTLGRKRPNEPNLKDRMFGSRNSLNKVQHQQPEGGQMFNSTIISNPHATYGKAGERPPRSGDVSPGQTGHNYVNINYLSPDGMPPRPLSGLSSPGNGYSWPKSNGVPLGNNMRMALSETESMESLSSTASSSIQAQIQQARASALASRNILQGLNMNTNMGLHRSDSFKSTKSEKVFPTSHPEASDLQRTNSFTQLCNESNPNSPTHRHSQGLGYPHGPMVSTPNQGLGNLSRPSSTASSSSPYANVFLPLSKLSSSKDEDLHGSSLSLVSCTSSVYSTAEEKHSAEAHVVAAFEQSLSNMTQRLQTLSCTAEAKDSEVAELRATIESLRQQTGLQFSPDCSFSPSSIRRQSSNSSSLGKESITPESTKGLTRHRSTDSVSSMNSMSSACSGASQQSSATDRDSDKKKNKKKNWLRSSFSKAFSRKQKNGKSGSMSDAEIDIQSLRSDTSVPNSPLLQIPHPMSMPTTPVKSSNSSGMLCDSLGRDDPVLDLQQQLHEKDMKLTEIRLESLSSVHQLEQLRETMTRMKSEMHSLKADNDRLHRIMSNKGLSPTSPPPESLDKRLSLGDPSSLDLMLTESPDRDGRRITLSVYLNSTSEYCKLGEGKQSEVLIGAISVSGKTKWDMLDSVVKRAFKEYILRIDPVTNLGLNGDSINCYNIGDLLRSKETEIPELLPCGYLVGDSTNIAVTLKAVDNSSVDSLSFETLIPKSIVQRYISLLLEHKRIILCGPSGTGKTFLAQKLAEYLVQRSGKEPTAGSIATFNVDHKSSKELRQYLANIADQCESTNAGELPNVIILDNLHHVSSLGEVFNGFLSVKHRQCPYIIGTMNQTTCSTTNLQLHHNFRWVLCANHMEPVKGFLGRFLRRKLVQEEVKSASRNHDLSKIIDWVPKVWQHLNKFLETHSSSDVTIGPRLFLSCPMSVSGAQVWFTDLWNYSIVPYLLDAVREGIQTYGRRAPWEDPADWVIESYPWTNTGSSEWPSLLKLRPEDVGYDVQGASQTTPAKTVIGAAPSDAEGDPLMNMLMRLQEAASYSSPQSNDSDSTSLDSHSSAHDFVPTSTVATIITTNSSIESTI